MIDHHSALIYTMVLVSAADAEMTQNEVDAISEVVRYLPVFRDFDRARIPAVSEACVSLIQDENGLEKTLAAIREGLPRKLRETAYAIACDVAASDGRISQEVLRLLEMLRHELEIDRLSAAAIERGARARHATL
jgi:tellurite resistance protein